MGKHLRLFLNYYFVCWMLVEGGDLCKSLFNCNKPKSFNYKLSSYYKYIVF